MEKYNAKPEPIIAGKEQITRLIIESSEKGKSLFKEFNFIEN
jgi:hypothetical protein